jgi:hypothetical protein
MEALHSGAGSFAESFKASREGGNYMRGHGFQVGFAIQLRRLCVKRGVRRREIGEGGGREGMGQEPTTKI